MFEVKIVMLVPEGFGVNSQERLVLRAYCEKACMLWNVIDFIVLQ